VVAPAGVEVEAQPLGMAEAAQAGAAVAEPAGVAEGAQDAAGTPRWAPHRAGAAVTGVPRWAPRAGWGAESAGSQDRVAETAGVAVFPCRAIQAARGVAAAASSPAQFCLMRVTWRVNAGFGQTKGADAHPRDPFVARVCRRCRLVSSGTRQRFPRYVCVTFGIPKLPLAAPMTVHLAGISPVQNPFLWSDSRQARPRCHPLTSHTAPLTIILGSQIGRPDTRRRMSW
jgi:hypothetical protein